jgi:hypothetical protein
LEFREREVSVSDFPSSRAARRRPNRRARDISRGDYAGLPHKGEETLVGIRIHRILEGKITEEWSTLDVRPVWEDLAQEIRKRERVEQDLRVARRIQ